MINLLDRIDAYLLEKESVGRKREAHWASDAAACKRQLFYKWTGAAITNPTTAGGIWKMRMGDGIHSMVHEFLTKSGLQVMDEISLRLGPEITGLKRPLSGRIDNVFEEPGTNDLAEIEVKSGYGAGIRAIKAGGPKREHLIQALVYLKWGGLARCHLVYVARDDGYRCEFIMEYDSINDVLYLHDGGRKWASDLTYAEIHARLAAVEDAVESGKLPERDFWQAIKNGEYRDDFQKDKVKYRSNWQCSYCGFRDACWDAVKAATPEGDNLAMRGQDDEADE